MRCIHVQRNFGFAYSKEMIHQNCRWLWRRRKHRFSLCAWCPPVVFMFSYSGVNQTHQWQILVLCKRYRRVCLVFFCEYSVFWKAGIQFSMQPVGFGCANSEFPDLDWAHFSQSSHTGVPDSDLTHTWLLQGLFWIKGFVLESLPSAVILLKCHHGSTGTFKELMLGQIVTQDRELKGQGLLLSGNGV